LCGFAIITVVLATAAAAAAAVATRGSYKASGGNYISRLLMDNDNISRYFSNNY